MDDYEIAIRKWAFTKIQVLLDNKWGKHYGFAKDLTWRDLHVEEYENEGWQSDDSFAEPADHGFRISAFGSQSYEVSTKFSLGQTIFEISRIEITDEDRQ